MRQLYHNQCSHSDIKLVLALLEGVSCSNGDIGSSSVLVLVVYPFVT